MHVIPWKLLSQGVKPADPALGADSPVVIKPQLLRLLIEAALANQNFDEASYLAGNPDVAQAIRAGKLRSGRAHYIKAGYFEGRGTGPAGFDEAWYLQRYPDVQEAVKRGSSANGHEHFRGPGILEWRSPTRAAEADIGRWRNVIDPAGPKARAVSSPDMVEPTDSASPKPVSAPSTEMLAAGVPAVSSTARPRAKSRARAVLAG